MSGGAVTITGPTAIGGDIRRFLVLTWTIAVLEFKLRFFGSVLGYVWQLMRPLLLFSVIYIVFTQAFKLADDVAFYPVTLLMGIVLFTFFADATGTAVTSVVDRENIVRKIHFPRLAIPASVVVTAGMNLGLNFIVIGIFLVSSGVTPHWGWLEVPFLLAYLFVYTLGVSMLVSAWYVRYRDVQPIWDVALQIIFYGSPVLYVIEKIDVEWIKDIMFNFNPLAPFLQQMRHALIDPNAPSAAEVMGGKVHLLVPITLVCVIFAGGLYVFSRAAPRIAEDL